MQESMDIKKRIAVHDGTFHADDVFAVATLLLMYPDAEVLRTRDRSILDTADIVVDVGDVYDEAANRFDHHQKGGAGERQSGIPYAGFGLVWKKYGERVAGSLQAANLIDARLVAAIDGPDNGVSLIKPLFENYLPYTMGTFVESWNPTWQESDETLRERFFDAVTIADRIIRREIVRAASIVVGFSIVEKAYADAPDKRVVVLPQENLPWREIAERFPEALYVVEPKTNQWKLKTVQSGIFVNRKSLPASWAGLRDEQLADVTGVQDALFCHNKRFLVVARTKEGILALAEKALAA